MDSTAQAGFYKWEPDKVEDVFDGILRVADEEGLAHKWDGDAPATPADIGLDDVLLLRDDETHLRIRFEPVDETERRLNYFLSLSASVRHLTVGDEDDQDYSGFTATFVNLIRRLSETLEPDYVFISHPDTDTGPSPLEVMPTEDEFELQRLPWLSVYSPSLLNQFGWTERISDAPAWKVEELGTGAVLLIKTREPWMDVSRDHPLDEYLLDSKDA